MILWRGFPFAGVPPRFESSVEYQDFVDLLLRSGAIPDAKTVYWSVRPSSRYQTLELRMCDVCPRLSDAVAITALARALVVAASQKVLEPIGTSLSESLQDELLTENEWIAARDGLDANLIAPESSGGCLPIRRAISDLLRTVGPIADAFGDDEALGGVEKILDGGNAADRMRARLATGDIRAVVQYLVSETSAGTGIDRRTESR
jgi:carboxylate-amine ligase